MKKDISARIIGIIMDICGVSEEKLKGLELRRMITTVKMDALPGEPLVITFKTEAYKSGYVGDSKVSRDPGEYDWQYTFPPFKITGEAGPVFKKNGEEEE